MLAAVVQQAAGTILSWVNTCFEDAAAAAAEAFAHTAQNDATQQQQQQRAQTEIQQKQRQLSPHVGRCAPLRRPLPLHTLLSLCDRPGASLRQSLADVAAVAVEACGGCLPRITRTYELDGVELVADTLGPDEWLWSHCHRDTRAVRKLRAGGGGASGAEEGGDLEVLESM